MTLPRIDTLGLFDEVNGHLLDPAASVTLPPDVAWKVWTKRRPVEEKLRAWPAILVEGDVDLGRLVVGMVSVMA